MLIDVLDKSTGKFTLEYVPDGALSYYSTGDQSPHKNCSNKTMQGIAKSGGGSLEILGSKSGGPIKAGGSSNSLSLNEILHLLSILDRALMKLQTVLKYSIANARANQMELKNYLLYHLPSKKLSEAINNILKTTNKDLCKETKDLNHLQNFLFSLEKELKNPSLTTNDAEKLLAQTLNELQGFLKGNQHSKFNKASNTH